MLFNSGGVMFPPVEQLTADGYDLQFGTNVLGPCTRPSRDGGLTDHPLAAGHFYLTQLLIPVLLSGASHSPEGRVRVINTSSTAHTCVSGIDFDTLKEHAKRKKLGTQKLHFQSKFVSASFGGACAREHVSLTVADACGRFFCREGDGRFLERAKPSIRRPGDHLDLTTPG